jgi:hypothetical protein
MAQQRKANADEGETEHESKLTTTSLPQTCTEKTQNKNNEGRLSTRASSSPLRWEKPGDRRQQVKWKWVEATVARGGEPPAATTDGGGVGPHQITHGPAVGRPQGRQRQDRHLLRHLHKKHKHKHIYKQKHKHKHKNKKVAEPMDIGHPTKYSDGGGSIIGPASKFNNTSSHIRHHTSEHQTPDFRLQTPHYRTSDFSLHTTELQTSDSALQRLGLQTSDSTLQTPDFRFPDILDHPSIPERCSILARRWTGVYVASETQGNHSIPHNKTQHHPDIPDHPSIPERCSILARRWTGEPHVVSIQPREAGSDAGSFPQPAPLHYTGHPAAKDSTPGRS